MLDVNLGRPYMFTRVVESISFDKEIQSGEEIVYWKGFLSINAPESEIALNNQKWAMREYQEGRALLFQRKIIKKSGLYYEYVALGRQEVVVPTQKASSFY